jgi:lysozyme
MLLRLIAGIFRIWLEWLHSAWRWIQREEKLTLHFFLRFFAVERRLNGLQHFTFLWRLLRFLVHRYHLLPSWLKLLKLVALAGLFFSQPLWQEYTERTQQQKLYQFYYDHALPHYQRYTTPEDARKLASAYASEFSAYYLSPAYKEALRVAVPTQPTPQLIKAVANAPSVIREMKTAEVGIALIKHFESVRLRPYRDAVGKYTIGYGHLLRKGETYEVLTHAQAHQLLLRDIHMAELIVKKHVRVPLSASQFSALVSLVYNIGEQHFRTSTLLSVLNQKNYLQAAEEIRRWEKAGGKVLAGLTRRRYAEYLLFTGKWRLPT